MPGRIDPENPLLSIKIGKEKKQILIKRSEKAKMTLTQYVTKILDIYLEET